jgi:hypothetical protein
MDDIYLKVERALAARDSARRALSRMSRDLDRVEAVLNDLLRGEDRAPSTPRDRLGEAA